MMKQKRNIGNEIIESVKQAVDYIKGKKVNVAVHQIVVSEQMSDNKKTKKRSPANKDVISSNRVN